MGHTNVSLCPNRRSCVMPQDSSSTLRVWMGEVSNGLSSSWQMRSDGPPPPTPSNFSKMTRKDHTSGASLRGAGVGEPRREPEGPQYGQHGFDYFGRNKSRSAAGTIPGNTEKLIDAMIVKPRSHVFHRECLLLSKPTLYLGCSSPSGQNKIIDD